MTFFSGILLSGWFQIILLSFGFFAYSRAIFLRGFTRGYALGWLLGLLFIVAYTSVNPPRTLQMGGFDRDLTIAQVMFASVSGVFISLGLAIISGIFRNSYRWQALRAAGVTAMLVTAIFIQIIAVPEIRLMVSLFVLAFAITALIGFILRRGNHSFIKARSNPDNDYDNQDNYEDEPVSYVGRVRQRIIRRINRNEVPTDRSIYPQ